MIAVVRGFFIGSLAVLLMLAAVWARGDEPPAAVQANLNSEQRAWLEQHGPLRVGVVLRAPYAQFDQRLQQLSGVHVDLMSALAAALRAELSWRTYPDQTAMEKALAAGELDLAPGLMQTPTGLRLWLFSDPYLRVSQLLIGERDGSGTVDLENLDTLSRVVVRMPSATADYLRANYPHLNLQGVPLERQALQLLLSQQARYAVVDEAQLSRLFREPEFAGLTIVGDIGLPQLLRIASRRDAPELAAIVGEALLAIPAKELDQLHARWMPLTSSRFTESTALWKNLCLLLLVMLLACLAIVIWQRRMQQTLEQQLLDAREDIARRLAGEEALRLAQFSIDQSTVGILWVNWDSRVRYANQAAETMLGYPAGTVVDRPLIDFEPGLHMDRWLNLWRNARSSEDGPQVFETNCIRADGSVLPTDVSLSFLRFREAEYLVVFLSDVSERRRAHEQLRELSAHLESVREEEKARIAREVHDELGQMLTVLKLETSMCELAYADLDPGLSDRLNSMKRLISQLFQLVRDVATALRPPILDAGIASAIEWQARRFEERTQIPCLVLVPDNLPALSDARAIGMFRILQEALTNVMRHAQAHSVQISLTLADNLLCLNIADDGKGFDPQAGRPSSFGLVGMRERVLMLGGRLELDSEPGEGTALYVYIPLDPVEQGVSHVIRVLVAEDHTIVREGIKQLIGLAKDLQVVGEAGNGEQLLEILRQVPCEVVLLDISMPGVNGLEAIPRIRALNNPPAILVLSMHDEAQMAARALKVGAAGYATKDSDPALLLTAIRRVAAGGRYIDPDLADRMVFEVGLTDNRPLHSLLSEREFSVFERLAQGANVNDIAQQLALSSKTISTHKARLMQKLNVHSLADLVKYAMEHKLL